MLIFLKGKFKTHSFRVRWLFLFFVFILRASTWNRIAIIVLRARRASRLKQLLHGVCIVTDVLPTARAICAFLKSSTAECMVIQS